MAWTRTQLRRRRMATAQRPRFVLCYNWASADLEARSAPYRRDYACRSLHHVGEWLSLVEHLVRDQGVGGSNPLSPTNLIPRMSKAWSARRFWYGGNLGPFGSNEQSFYLLHCLAGFRRY